jgi:hypothetical protein
MAELRARPKVYQMADQMAGPKAPVTAHLRAYAMAGLKADPMALHLADQTAPETAYH